MPLRTFQQGIKQVVRLIDANTCYILVGHRTRLQYSCWNIHPYRVLKEAVTSQILLGKEKEPALSYGTEAEEEASLLTSEGVRSRFQLKLSPLLERSFSGLSWARYLILPESYWILQKTPAQNPELIRRPPDFCSLFGPTPPVPLEEEGEGNVVKCKLHSCSGESTPGPKSGWYTNGDRLADGETVYPSATVKT
ncbi:hypothetical protein CEXT_29541 [Caerostris extrusa]|uniref:Uncharacterized protein n=1 Tax=Caerostris extrusa TaxID=172846 RepID=A0AAV4XVF1_CAEEX|nr:hypothetical protein CEXT_29541 [Caerostris extrusa]